MSLQLVRSLGASRHELAPPLRLVSGAGRRRPGLSWPGPVAGQGERPGAAAEPGVRPTRAIHSGALGGRMEVESSEGKGSTFRIRLPALSESGSSRDPSTPESAPRTPARVG